ncbi:MAG: carboxypeptidase regulatory-like domain-containing protein [Anaerolineaceae bacterium]
MNLTRVVKCLPVLAIVAATPHSAAAADSTGVDHELAGIVTDVSSTPLPEVEVLIVKPAGAGRKVITAKDGHFAIAGVPEGQILVRFRRLGYEARDVEVNVTKDKRTSLNVMLKPVPAELDSMLIRSEEQNALREFYDHKSTRGSFAKFYTAEDIRKRGAAYPTDMFRNVPGITLTASSYTGSTVRIRGCQPMLFIDGQRVANSEVDDVVSASDIAGLEFYTSMAGTPAQYMDRTTRACGSILVWTKNR